MSVTDPDLAFAAIAEVAPGGHYFGAAHTLERYEHALYEPQLSKWQNNESWQLDGGADATTRATAIWKQALAEYEAPAMDPAIREALDAYVVQRRAEIGSDDP
jgi:trimethylamine--corrinoid protein Co-methyltransferase